MSLDRLVLELDGVKERTVDFVEKVSEALSLLTNPKLGAETAREEAVTLLGEALNGQQDLEFLCQNMALAVRQFALLPPNTPQHVFDEVWANLVSALEPMKLS